MPCSLAVWVTTVHTPTPCTACYERRPTPGSCTRQRKLCSFSLRNMLRVFVWKDQVQCFRVMQPCVRCGDVLRGGPTRLLRQAYGGHHGNYDGVTHRTHRGVGLPRPGRRFVLAPRLPSSRTSGASGLVTGDT